MEQSQKCQIHDSEKNFCFCLEKNCKDRLVCQECYVRDRKHNNCTFVLVKNILSRNIRDMSQMFEKQLVEMFMNGRDINDSIVDFDSMVQRLMNEIEQNVQEMVATMLQKNRILVVDQLKSNLYNQLKLNGVSNMSQVLNDFQDMVDGNNSLQKQQDVYDQINSSNYYVSVKKKFDEVVKEIERINSQTVQQIQMMFDTKSRLYKTVFETNVVVNTQRQNEVEVQNVQNVIINDVNQQDDIDDNNMMANSVINNNMMANSVINNQVNNDSDKKIERQKSNKKIERQKSDIKEVNKLKNMPNKVRIQEFEKFKNTIKQYEEKKEDYQIIFNFNTNKEYSIKDRLKYMDIVDELGVNSKVGAVRMKIERNDQVNKEILEMINERYMNIHEVWIRYSMDEIDECIHESWIDLIRNKHLMTFSLYLQNGMGQGDKGVEILKKYNQQIGKNCEHLQYLCYRSNQIDQLAEPKEKIVQLIAKIENM